jgi:hypothetical protein
MAYTIYNNDGSILLILPDSEVDGVTTSLSLIGKNVNNYGEYFNNNLVKLLTSFANTAGNEPANPQIGQLFFNKTTGRLTAYNGNSFVPTNGSWLSRPLTPASGDFYFNTAEDQLFIWTGTNYKLVGPALPRSAGKFGIEPSTATITADITYAPQPSVGLIYAYNNAVGMISPTSFKMSTVTSNLYLSTSTATQLIAGLTLFQSLDVKGNATVGGTFTATNLSTVNITTYPAGSNSNLLIDPDGTGDVIFSTATQVIVYDTATSISTTTGALVVAGGVGIREKLYVGGRIFSGDIITSGFVLATQNITSGLTLEGKNLDISGTNTSISTITGAVTIAGGVGIGGAVNIGQTIAIKTYTVATLPSGVQGMKAFVSDSNTSTFYSVVASGGSFMVPVYYTGSAWRIG